MENGLRKRSLGAAALQGIFALVAIIVLALAPPPFGRFLLIPLNGHQISDSLLRQELLDRRRPGPIPGSVIVDGQSAGAASIRIPCGSNACATPANWQKGDKVVVPPPQTIDDASKRMEDDFKSKNEVTDWYLSKRELGK